MNWRLAYRLGFHPWEDATDNRDFVDQITRLFACEESGLSAPFGRALDIGTGSGIWGIELARRGWQVTGIDIADNALQRARKRAVDAAVDISLLQADVTDLRAANIGSGFRLVLDSGTFHSLAPAQRHAMGAGVDAVVTPDATVLLLVWEPRRRPMIRGASRSDVEAAFPDWRVTDVEPVTALLPKPIEFVMRPGEQWYRLRRR
jgi:SAM-dependent methyltransferase